MPIFVLFCDDMMVRVFDSREKAENLIAALKSSPHCKDWGVYRIEKVNVE